jgi:hypothetical protein
MSNYLCAAIYKMLRASTTKRSSRRERTLRVERSRSPTAAGSGRWLRIRRPNSPGPRKLKRGAAVRCTCWLYDCRIPNDRADTCQAGRKMEGKNEGEPLAIFLPQIFLPSVRTIRKRNARGHSYSYNDQAQAQPPTGTPERNQNDQSTRNHRTQKRGGCCLERLVRGFARREIRSSANRECTRMHANK